MQSLMFSQSVGKTWTAAFSIQMDIPGAEFSIAIASLKAHAVLNGQVSAGVAGVSLNIGACGCVGVWKLKKCWCDPTNWLPVKVWEGKYDFSPLCQ